MQLRGRGGTSHTVPPALVARRRRRRRECRQVVWDLRRRRRRRRRRQRGEVVKHVLGTTKTAIGDRVWWTHAQRSVVSTYYLIKHVLYELGCCRRVI